MPRWPKRESRCIALHFLQPRRWMGVGGQSHAPAAVPPRKTRYPLYRRLGGPQSRSRRARKISPPTGIRSPDRPARSESLYRLSYPGPLSLLITPQMLLRATRSKLTRGNPTRYNSGAFTAVRRARVHMMSIPPEPSIFHQELILSQAGPI